MALEQSSIFKCAFDGKIIKLKELLKKDQQLIHAADRLNRNLLHYAAINGQANICKLLISKGIHVNTCDQLGKTALHWAAQKGNYDVVKILTSKKYKIETQDLHGATALHYATFWPNCLHIILKSWSVTNIDCVDANERTALHWSAFYGNAKSTAQLLKYGVTIDKLDVDRKSPLHWAVCSPSSESTSCAKLILEHAPDLLNGQDCHGRTCLHWAVSDAKVEHLEFLLGVPGIEIDRADNVFLTPLHWAAQLGMTEKLKVLLEASANSSICDKNKYKPIHYAIVHNHLEAVELLIPANMTSEMKSEILKMAELHNATDVIRYIRHLSCYDNFGSTSEQ